MTATKNFEEQECVSVVEYDAVSEQQTSLTKTEALKKWEIQYDQGLQDIQKKYREAESKEERNNIDEERKEYKKEMAIRKTQLPDDPEDIDKRKKRLSRWAMKLRTSLKRELSDYGVPRSGSVVLVPMQNIAYVEGVIDKYKVEYAKLHEQAKADGYPFRTNCSYGFSAEVADPSGMLDIEMHKYHPDETEKFREKASEMGLRQLEKLIGFLDEHIEKIKGMGGEIPRRNSIDRIRTELDTIVDIMQKFNIYGRKEIRDKIEDVDRKFSVYRDLCEE